MIMFSTQFSFLVIIQCLMHCPFSAMFMIVHINHFIVLCIHLSRPIYSFCDPCRSTLPCEVTDLQIKLFETEN